MAWTYDSSLATPKDQVRFLIGDVIAEDPQMQDEEIIALLGVTSNAIGSASVMAARSLAARYSRQADYWVGDLKLMASQRASAYYKLAGQLEEAGPAVAIGGSVRQVPFAGGISLAQKELLRSDTDFPPTSFSKGMHDNECGD